MKALTPHISRTSGPVAVEVVRYRSHVQGSLPTNLGSLVLNYTCQHDHATPESAATCQRKIERAFKHAGSAAIRRYGIGLPDRDVEWRDGETVHAAAGTIIQDIHLPDAQRIVDAAMIDAGFVA